MSMAPEKFAIHYDGISYNVERSMSDENIYKLSSPKGVYLVSKDFYGDWIELTRRSGSADLPITQVGEQIERHCNKISSF